MGDLESQLTIAFSQTRLPVEGLGCIQLKSRPKVSRGNSQTTQADAKTKGCFLKTGSGALLSRAHPHSSLNMKKSSWC